MKNAPLGYSPILILIFSIAFAVVLHGQHHVNAIFYDQFNLSAVKTTEMFEGGFDRNQMTFVKIPTLVDGEIKLEADDFQASDNVLLRLVNNATGDSYGIRLSNMNITVEAPGGVNLAKGSFLSGDSFRVVRCQNSILFFYNGKLLHQIGLANNNFTMNGNVLVTAASNTLAEIWFRQL